MAKDEISKPDGNSVSAVLLLLDKVPMMTVGSVAIVSALVLWLPAPVSDSLGFSLVQGDRRTGVGVVLALSSVLLCLRFAKDRWDAYQRPLIAAADLAQRQARLHHLTGQEKEMLRKFINERKRVASFHIDHHAVNALVHERILTDVKPFMTHISFVCRIEEWAFDYLTENPRCLDADATEIANRRQW